MQRFIIYSNHFTESLPSWNPNRNSKLLYESCSCFRLPTLKVFHSNYRQSEQSKFECFHQFTMPEISYVGDHRHLLYQRRDIQPRYSSKDHNELVNSAVSKFFQLHIQSLPQALSVHSIRSFSFRGDLQEIQCKNVRLGV